MSTLDHRLDRLFTLLGTATLRSRERFLAQQQPGSQAATVPVAGQAVAAPAPAAAAPATIDQHLDRVFTLLETATLRSRARFVAQQGPREAQFAAQREAAAAHEAARRQPPTDDVARLFDLLATATLRRREAFLAQQVRAA